MPRSEDIVDRWLASKEEGGCKSNTLRQYRSMVQTTFDALSHAGRPTDPRIWTVADARWLRGRFSEEPVRMSIVAGLTRFAGSAVFGEVRTPRRKRSPHPARGPSADQLRALLGIDEWHRRPKLIVLLGLDRGPGDTEWLQLPAEYIDLKGNRQLLRRDRIRNPALVVPQGPRKERATELGSSGFRVGSLLKREGVPGGGEPSCRMPNCSVGSSVWSRPGSSRASS